MELALEILLGNFEILQSHVGALVTEQFHVYRHEYEVVDESPIWYTAQNGIEALRRMATVELESLASGDAK